MRFITMLMHSTAQHRTEVTADAVHLVSDYQEHMTSPQSLHGAGNWIPVTGGAKHAVAVNERVM